MSLREPGCSSPTKCALVDRGDGFNRVGPPTLVSDDVHVVVDDVKTDELTPIFPAEVEVSRVTG
jgi:hypothetical protein